MNDCIPFFPARPTRIWSESDVFCRLVIDPLWACEPKLDGYRVVVVWMQAGVEAWTRHGKPQSLAPDVRAGLERLDLPKGTAVDGELLGPRQAGAAQRFVAFDLPVWAGVLDRQRPLDMRRSALRASGLSVIERLPNKPESFERALAAGHEGLVLKRRDAVYPFATGPHGQETHLWLKAKAATADGRLIGRERG